MDLSKTESSFPYYPISRFYRKLFGEKVYKIPISIAETCPNREGLRGMKTCNFCDVWGSAAFPEYRDYELRRQIEMSRDRVKRRVNAKKFLVYFQAYTNTFTKVSRLREQFELAASYPDVVGIVVGTRPDCLSDAVFDLWNEYAEKLFLSVELGVQSFNEDQLIWMRRGHTAQKSIEAIYKIRKKTSKIDLGIHLMFGLPNESLNDIKESALICNDLPIDNVKLHNLHVLKNTPLEKDYHQGKFQPLTREEYTNYVIHFLKHLKPEIAVHRLMAVSSRRHELVAPAWTATRMESYQVILDEMKNRGAYQGQNYKIRH